jgi:DNA-binding NtrC family response regulator
MNTKNALISFVGKQDPLNKKGKPGPLLTLLARNKFHHVYLLYTESPKSNEMKSRARETADAIRKECSIDTTTTPIQIVNPADLEEVFRKTKQVFRKLRRRLEKYRIYISLTSGTPQMHISMFLLTASGEIHATMLYQPDPAHSDVVKEINPWKSEIPSILPHLPKGGPEAVIESSDTEEMCHQIGITGRSLAIRKAIDKAAGYAGYNVPVLILGESGTGKELFAKLIHQLSDRRDRRFLAFNCAAITETLAESALFGHKKGSFTDARTDKDGLFKQADGGTLFLDEIGELSPLVQAKLLRVLEDGTFIPLGGKNEEKVDVRIIAATNRDLEHMVNDGRFREDLYYRINILQISLPSLRDRKEDIPDLARHILEEFCKENDIKREFTEDAIRALMVYHWPGNVRQLRTVVWRLAIESREERIDYSDIELPTREEELVKSLPIEPYRGFNIGVFDEIRDYYYEKALQMTDGNQSKAGELLGLTGQAVHNWLKKKGRI